ncbi:MAG TPA: hypothetical protein VGE01_14585, partial [Fimbriimonas sp.]
DAQIVASLVDGVIFIAEPGKVKEASLHYAVHLMRQARANVIGVVFNQVGSQEMENAFYYGARSTAYGVFQGLPAWQTPELPSRAVSETPEPSPNDSDPKPPTSGPVQV